MNRISSEVLIKMLANSSASRPPSFLVKKKAKWFICCNLDEFEIDNDEYDHFEDDFDDESFSRSSDDEELVENVSRFGNFLVSAKQFKKLESTFLIDGRN